MKKIARFSALLLILGLGAPCLKAAPAALPPAGQDWAAPAAHFAFTSQAFNSWEKLVAYAQSHGISAHIPIPQNGTREVRLLTQNINDDSQPLFLFAVYGRNGAKPFTPEGLYLQSIYTMPGKTVSYIFLSSLAGKLLAAYTAYSSNEGSGTTGLPIDSPETILRFQDLKSLWIHGTIDKGATPQNAALILKRLAAAAR